MNFKTFLEKNKVFILGLLGAIAVNVQQFFLLPEPDYHIVAFTGVAAGLSYWGNKLRGQYITIGAILTSLGAVMAAGATGVEVNWFQTITLGVINGLAVVSSPPKSVGYEKTEVIKEAKAEGKVIEKSDPPSQ